MPPHPLTNFEIQKYHQKNKTLSSKSKPKFNGVYSRNKLPKIKDAVYVINLDEYKSIGTHWIALYVDAENVTYFDRFGVEHTAKEIQKVIGNKNIITIIHRIQAFGSIMCRYFWLGLLVLY